MKKKKTYKKKKKQKQKMDDGGGGEGELTKTKLTPSQLNFVRKAYRWTTRGAI